jgi:hypothetical protein
MTKLTEMCSDKHQTEIVAVDISDVATVEEDVQDFFSDEVQT